MPEITHPDPNAPVIVTRLGSPDPNDDPGSIDELFQMINDRLWSQMHGGYITYIMQAPKPGIDLQNQVWIQKSTDTDQNGKPLSINLFYNGNWRRLYNGMLGEIRVYSGNPGDDFDVHADPTIAKGLNQFSKGKIGGQYDGWHLCNGQDGTPNLTDRFVVGGHMDNSAGHTGYSTNWQSFVDTKADSQTGGSGTSTITAQYLPPLGDDPPKIPPDPVVPPSSTNKHEKSMLKIKGYEYSSTETHTTPQFLIDTHYAAGLVPTNISGDPTNSHPQGTHHTLTLLNYGSNPAGDPAVAQQDFPLFPPFIAFGFIIFLGY